MSQANQSEGEETASYSEEEVMDVEEIGADSERERAIEAILSESEILENKETPRQRKGKQRVRSSPLIKSPSHAPSSTEGMMWKVLAKLTEEVKSLKRPQAIQQGSGETPKRAKITVSDTGTAYDRPSSSRQAQPSENETQLSSGTVKQLSSAQSKQLKTAKNDQLSSDTRERQLSSAAMHEEQDDDAVVIHDDENDDPLRIEQEEFQQGLDHSGDDESSDEEDAGNDDIFEDMVGAIDIQGEEETPGPALLQVWADKINLAWKTKINKTALNSTMLKYKIPSNCEALKVPSMNKDIWNLLNKWQRKADLNLSSCQRNLLKAVSAVLKLHENFTTLPRSTRQLAMQTTVDVVSLLGKVNRELASKRKISARPALLGDYKSLATTTEVSDANLFGDNLTQDIKDVNTEKDSGSNIIWIQAVWQSTWCESWCIRLQCRIL